ncbi:MAG: tRNA (adenosine(37)-N6)-threonylcarbamoyltransferase complex transferase subunit TsaD [Verrucomicrobiales bacterium]
MTPLLLAIETSCDESAVACISQDGSIIGQQLHSQVQEHRQYGGVVPELATREHVKHLPGLVDRFLAAQKIAPQDISAVAATRGPGLASSLLVGWTFSKALAWALKIPLYGINHMEGHLLSPFAGQNIRPGLALIVSGGHTMIVKIRGLNDYSVLGRTRDDAAGEAFDKVAKLIGLPYPGGPAIEEAAKNGNGQRFQLPRSLPHEGDFSFSGLKTAVRYLWEKLSPQDQADVAASFQEAVVDALVSKAFRWCKDESCELLMVSGGVSCNERLRNRLQEEGVRQGVEVLLAPKALTTDNAAMIGLAGWYRMQAGFDAAGWQDDVDPNLGWS